ncbi:MAG: copper amine oxidase N-terminal domain-containing protein [Clostridiales bacterium]|jgi:hypothetical protein|nr:copper amine oxidase N-terminal domain-containing protein [Clostridiales bacterium]
MKKKIFAGLLIMAALMVFNAALVLADDIRVQFDGVYVHTQPAPIIVEGRAMLPARAIVEMLGGEIYWDDELRQVLINQGGTRIVLTIDRPTVYVNGAPQQLDVPPQIVEGRTLVPLRFVAESLGLDVDFSEGTVFITTARMAMVTHEDFVLSDGSILSVLYTPVVRRGSEAEVFFTGTPNVAWYLTIQYATGYGTAAGLGHALADEEGFVKWAWRVGSNTTIGDWPVTIVGGGERLHFYLSIVSAD